MSDVSTLNPRSAALELTALVIGIELLVWGELFPGFPWLQAPLLLSLAALCWRSHRRRAARPSASASSQAAARSWLSILLATAVAAGLLLGVTRAFGWWSGDAARFDVAAFATWADLWWWLEKAGTVVLQQCLLQFFVLPLLLEATGSRVLGLLLSGVVFGALHLPNPVLSILTAGAAPVWCWLYLWSGRWLPLVVSHLLLAILVRGACGDAIYSMRVGASVLPLLPRSIEAADGSQLRVSPRSLEGFLDSCAVQGEKVVCSGWAADVDRRRPSRSLVVLGGGGMHPLRVSRTPRPDVSSFFAMPELLESGFEVEVPIEWFESRSAPRFFGVSENQAAELEYLTDRRISR